MRKKQLANQSEQRTFTVLDDVLRDSPFRAFCRVRLTDVIGPERGESLGLDDRELLGSSHFDFVVYSIPQGLHPEFVLEFDGARHQRDPKQTRRDIVKNRLCQKAKLPLIRITRSHLHEHDKITLLSYMISRFKAWHEEIELIEEEVRDRVSELAPEELEAMTDGILDPSIDPTFIFDCRHPFPATSKIARQLYLTFGIDSIHLEPHLRREARRIPGRLQCWVHPGETNYSAGEVVVVTYSYGVFREVRPQRELRWASGRLVTAGTDVLHEGRVQFGIRWTAPVVEDYDPAEPVFDYLMSTGRPPIMFLEIPGVHPPDIAEQFCEYLALRRVQKWAVKNICSHKTKQQGRTG